MKTGRIQTDGDPLKAVAALLRGMVENKVVDQVLAPAVQPSGGASLALFDDVEQMEAIAAWAPVMPVQGARMVSRMTFDAAGAKVAVLLRPCEARAAVELIKLKQINPEGITFVFSVSYQGRAREIRGPFLANLHCWVP